MNCPQCAQPLTEINTKSHYDKQILLDQCENCGGLWFDHHELYAIPSETAHAIDSIKVNKIGTTPPSAKPLMCPRDYSPLTRFSDENFPRNIIIERCNTCKGFWFNSGELTEYKNAIEKRNQSKDSLVQTSINSLDSNMFVSLVQFLTLPINRKYFLPEARDTSVTFAQHNIYQKETTLTYLILRFLLYGIGI